MATRVPPFSTEAEYTAVLAQLVPDAKGDRADADLVDDALQAYAEFKPAWETTDIGDGSATEWQLGAAPFGSFLVGYSDAFPLEVEHLESADTPHRPPLHQLSGWYTEERWDDSNSDHELFIVFESAPESGSLTRVKWNVPWSLTKVPTAHQMAVIYLAAELKCAALATHYRKTVDAGSDLFDGIGVAEGYERDAKKWRGRALTRLGLGSAGGSGGASSALWRGRVARSKRRVFDRGGP